MPIDKLLIAIMLGFSSFPIQFVWANDTSFGDKNGSITFKYQPNISMDKESLFISEKNIEVAYVFTNTSQQDLDIPIAFPMPPMYFGMSDHSKIEDFKLWVNGTSQKTEYRLVVRLNDKIDISSKLTELGWSANDVAGFIESDEIPQGKKPLPTKWFDKNNQPLFTMSNYFVWQQHFPAGKPVSIRHTYTPSITSGVPQPASYILKTYTKETCLDKNAQAAVRKRETAFGVMWKNLRYILVTANNWQGAIKDFNLTIKKEKADDLVSLCFDNDLKKMDTLTFEFHQKNYKPKHDLNLLFVRKPD